MNMDSKIFMNILLPETDNFIKTTSHYILQFSYEHLIKNWSASSFKRLFFRSRVDRKDKEERLTSFTLLKVHFSKLWLHLDLSLNASLVYLITHFASWTSRTQRSAFDLDFFAAWSKFQTKLYAIEMEAISIFIKCLHSVFEGDFIVDSDSLKSLLSQIYGV